MRILISFLPKRPENSLPNTLPMFHSWSLLETKSENARKYWEKGESVKALEWFDATPWQQVFLLKDLRIARTDIFQTSSQNIVDKFLPRRRFKRVQLPTSFPESSSLLGTRLDFRYSVRDHFRSPATSLVEQSCSVINYGYSQNVIKTQKKQYRRDSWVCHCYPHHILTSFEIYLTNCLIFFNCGNNCKRFERQRSSERRNAKAWNTSFRIYLRWPIYHCQLSDAALQFL